MPQQRELVTTKGFNKAFKKFTGNNQQLQKSIKLALFKLEHDAYDPSLKTHKLSGKLVAYLACSCGYDCRIIFLIEENPLQPGVEKVVLYNIGTHDDVY